MRLLAGLGILKTEPDLLAGFRLTRVVPTQSAASVVEAVKR
jgi:hypothetical protein